MNNVLKKLVITTFILSMCMSSIIFAKPIEPEINAESAILMEAETNTIIYEKNAYEKMYPASMTKILTALITLDYFEPNDVIIVGSEINEISLDSSKAGHKKGETLTVENLIRGLIIPSGNDTSNVIASAIAKKVKNTEELSYNECEEIFTNLMNEKAKSLGCKNSNFSNAHGYHNDNHYTTAYDMALISKEALKNELIKEIASEKSFSGYGAGDNFENDSSIKTQKYNWKSHNLLITDGEYNYKYATGLKTGFTNQAGDCVSATAEKDGTELIAIIMNSKDPNRWIDAKTLFEYGFNNYSINTLQKNGDIIETVLLTNNNKLNGDTLDVIIKEDVTEYMFNDDINNISREIQYNDELLLKGKDTNDKVIYLKAPISKDSEVGTITYMLNGEKLKEAKLYASEDVEKSTFISSTKYFIKNFFENVFDIKWILATIIVIVVIIIIFLIFKKFKRRRRNIYKYKISNRRRF